MTHLHPTDLPLHLALTDEFPSDGRLNSRVFSASMHPSPPSGWYRDSSGVRLRYEHYESPNPTLETVHCVFWDPHAEAGDGGRGTWTDNGCKVVDAPGTDTAADVDGDRGRTTCLCQHMTTYALLIKPLPDPATDVHDMPRRIVTYIGIIVSMVTLVVLAFEVFGFQQRHRDIPLILKNLTVSLVLLLLFVAIAESAGSSRPSLCQAMAIMQHYFYAVAFCWLWIEALDLVYAVTTAVMHGRAKAYVPLAWGLPLLPVIAICVVDLDAYGAQPHCWISNDGVYHYALFGALLALLLLATITTLIGICNLRTPALTDTVVLSHVHTALRNNAIMLLCLTLAWLLGWATVTYPRDVGLQYVGVFFYSFQGFFIVLAHVVGNPYFYVMREKYEDEKEEEEEDSKEEEEETRPDTARPKTAKVAPALYYRP